MENEKRIMTEAIAKAEHELALSKYLQELAGNTGMREIHRRRCEWLSVIVALAKKAIKADAVEVVHGRWLLEREPDGKPYCFHCSVCDGDFSYIGITTAYNYCPNCGAKMDGGNEDE